MAKAYKCTICGVSFGTPEGTRGHIQGSTGEHAGIGFADAEQYISEAHENDDEDADPPGGAPADPPSSPSSSGGLGIAAREQSEAKASAKDDPTCPKCESNEWFDASSTGYPYGCPHCSDPDQDRYFVYGEEEAA